MEEQNLVFIISQPRSGSTFLQNLLSNNTEVNTCSESWLLLNFANQIKPSLLSASFNNILAGKAFGNYVNDQKIDFTKKQKDFILELYRPLQEGYKLVIDKTPRYWEILEEVQQLFPESRIILLKRNPIDVASSIMKTWHIKSLSQLSTNYNRDLLIAPGKIHSFSLSNKTNKNVYVLRYEDLVGDTQTETEKIYNWLGIKYSSEVLDLDQNKKYKGEFGDPYQNSDKDYEEIKATSDLVELNKIQKNFIKGYAHYLGEDFLKEYGNYEFEDQKKTVEFAYFIHKLRNRNLEVKFKEEVQFLLKEVYFRFKKMN
ncbi:sulfotransferase family protein [Salegentibacter sediminis]|uniref:sulfotransferase family protein n=1 Tax=Salegentibacter sediminis TaxID=1930251 RepID=UPI0009BE2F16|nr:sulfotransferase [Salegentibacter sediminis]